MGIVRMGPPEARVERLDASVLDDVDTVLMSDFELED